MMHPGSPCIASAGQGWGQSPLSWDAGQGSARQAGCFSRLDASPELLEHLPAVSWHHRLQNLGNVLPSLCRAAQWVRERRLSPLHYHWLFSFFKNFVFKRRVNCFALTLQRYLLFKLPFLRDAAILYVQAMKL